jgi:hypothetical protein
MAILITVSTATRAQVVPVATGPSGPPVSGTLHYDLRYTQTAQFYNRSLGDSQRSNVSADLTYANARATRPFALTYSGGDSWTISGANTESGIFQHLIASQGFLGRAWAFNLSDNVSYVPQAPITGFSGIPGVGGLPGVPGEPVQPILTLNTRSIYNLSNANFKHRLDHATTLGISSNYGILRFPDGNGLETNAFQAGPQLTMRLNALNSLTSQYSFSHFSYTAYTITMQTQSSMFGYQRTWSRRLMTSVSAGPEWVQSSAGSSSPSVGNTIPATTDLTMNANLTYSNTRKTTATLSYIQATNGGAGVPTQIGVRNKDANATFTRQQGKNLTISFMGAYMRTQGLQQAGVTNGKVCSVSATRRWGRYIVVFANYSATQQSTSSALPATAIRGLSQVVSFGLGYSPLEVRLRK